VHIVIIVPGNELAADPTILEGLSANRKLSSYHGVKS
jgi:hypothetical protein